MTALATEKGLSAEDIRGMFRMDPSTGCIYWLESGKGRKAGQVAGNAAKVRDRYRWTVSFNGKRLFRSRIVFTLTHGRLPGIGMYVDHINGDSMDDRPVNLREATPKENARNRTVPVVRANGLPAGVTRLRSGRYYAKVTCDQKWVTVGTYDTPDEAHNAYLAKRKELFGDFA